MLSNKLFTDSATVFKDYLSSFEKIRQRQVQYATGKPRIKEQWLKVSIICTIPNWMPFAGTYRTFATTLANRRRSYAADKPNIDGTDTNTFYNKLARIRLEYFGKSS